MMRNWESIENNVIESTKRRVKKGVYGGGSKAGDPCVCIVLRCMFR